MEEQEQTQYNDVSEEYRILDGIESLENKNNENQIEVDQRRRGTDEEIKVRQNEIFKTFVDSPNITQEELADKFHVSISTIQRDLDVLRFGSLEWAENSGIRDHIHKGRIMSKRIDEQIAKMQYRINNENLDPKTEAYLMEKINDFGDLQLKIESTPIFKMLKIIDENVRKIPPQIRSTWHSDKSGHPMLR